MNRNLGTDTAATRDPTIRIRGARMHNLRELDVDLPRNRFVVVTGPSGSGKSSLAFDTLYAEGQRQYIESLSVYARQFLHQMERPDVDVIESLQPTVSIDQRAGSHNPRSTVATVTEIYDYLRLLYARLGEPTCHQCGRSIRQQSPEQILDELLALPDGTRVIVMAPMVRGRRGEHRDVFEQIRKAGLVRVRVDGQVHDVQAPPTLVRQKVHHIEAVVDRIVVREGVRKRLAESIALAIRHGDGLVLISWERGRKSDNWEDRLFSTELACPDCKISYEELEPRTFSFNSPYGACPKCDGLGVLEGFDPEMLVPDWSASMAAGAVQPWAELSPSAEKKIRAAMGDFLGRHKLRWDSPLEKLDPAARREFFHGSRSSPPTASVGTPSPPAPLPRGARGAQGFLGVLTLLEKEYVTTTSEKKRQRLEAFRGEVICPVCHGSRLREEARTVRVGGRAIHELTAMNVAEARQFVDDLSFPDEDQPIARPLVSEIGARLAFLGKVGVDYVTLDRPAATLSGGELQRVRLASGLGSGLVGVCYVLDEPSIGLHPRDNDRLIGALRELQQLGNTVVVVEHDEAIMRRADWLLDLGPGAGEHGGQIVAQGPPDDLAADNGSLTGRYLAGTESIPVPKSRRRTAKSRSITIEGVTTNNLKGVTVQFPLSALVCLTGVSGSGKSSLLNETLARALIRRLGGIAHKPGPHTSLRGVSQIDKVIEIDQSPIGRTPRSNPATYTGVFDEVRKVFAGTRDAKQRGYKAGRFSFNVKGGRCETCQGQGQQRIEMNFLPDLFVTCPTCEGRRFNRQTLEVQYRGRSIADVLEMAVDEAVEFFENFSTISRLLQSLKQVGLGYLRLGQPSTTLSGGEAQRIKLSTQLSRVSTGKTFYILDEPTTGLHFDDIRKLLGVLGRLVDLGNTVVVIEHNLDVIKSADWLIDLGPEGGADGGHVVATGTPEQIAAMDDNYTGRFLREALHATTILR